MTVTPAASTPVASSAITTSAEHDPVADEPVHAVADTNCSNQAIAAKPTTNAMITDTSSCGPVALMPSVTGLKASGSENSPEANTAGMASRKPNRAASSRSRPRNRPALMVAPERDTPGTRARHCARPTIRPSRQVSCSAWRVCLPKYSAAAITSENTISAVATIHRLRTPVRITSLNSRPEHAGSGWCR